MLVPFEQITQIQPSQASAINNQISLADGPITSGGLRTTLYDPLWGYFIFGQTLKMDYHDTRTYTDYGVFTIKGEFTVNAENSVAGNTVTADDDTFSRMVLKYEALETLFENAAKAAAPVNFSDWGGPNDPRCIPLPPPLLNASGGTIYALPMEVNIEPGLWGKHIAYTATLREAKFPSAKLMLNTQFVDGGILNVICPRPIISRKSLIGCCGEIVQVLNYTMAEFEAQGTVNGMRQPNRSMTDQASDLQQQLESDFVNIGIQRVTGAGTTTVDNLWTTLSLDEGSNVDINYAEQVITLNVKAKAGYNIAGGQRASFPF